jgi:hypothetical protein
MAFWRGFLVAIAGMSLYQDFFGLEGYINLLRDHWIPAARSVPVAIVALIVCALSAIAERMAKGVGRGD